MKYSVRPVLVSQKENSEGVSPIKICITIKGKRAYQSTGLFINEKDWNDEDGVVRRSHSSQQQYNNIIRNKIEEAEGIILSALEKKMPLNVQMVSRTLRGMDGNDSLIEYASALLKHSESKTSPGTIGANNSALKKLQSYQDPITFSEVTPAWLRKYETWLRKDLSNNTVHRHWKFLRKVVRSAHLDGISGYPFRNYSSPPKYRQTDRIHLTQEELGKVEEVFKKPLTENQVTTAYYFLLSCYSGLRISDLYRFNYEGFVHKDRLLLRAQKNGEWISMKIHTRLKNVLVKLKNLPLTFSEKEFRDNLSTIIGIAKVKKDITPHSGRHTFAVRCAEMGISIETTANLMGISVRECAVYYKITNRKTDKEMEKWG